MNQTDDRLRQAGASVRRATSDRPAPSAAGAAAHQQRRQAIVLRTAIALLVLGPLIAFAVASFTGDEGGTGDDAQFAQDGTPAPPPSEDPPATDPPVADPDSVLWTVTVRYDQLVAEFPELRYTSQRPEGRTWRSSLGELAPGESFTIIEEIFTAGGEPAELAITLGTNGTLWHVERIGILAPEMALATADEAFLQAQGLFNTMPAPGVALGTTMSVSPVEMVFDGTTGVPGTLVIEGLHITVSHLGIVMLEEDGSESGSPRVFADGTPMTIETVPAADGTEVDTSEPSTTTTTSAAPGAASSTPTTADPSHSGCTVVSTSSTTTVPGGLPTVGDTC